uniref:Uncharacterized protein n=1 Tax=Arion vulgaris TaxID=1028688 RepID=A0A0B6ZGG6_9EUPU
MGVIGKEREQKGWLDLPSYQPLNRADILKALIECGHIENFHFNQSMSTDRLQKFG